MPLSKPHVIHPRVVSTLPAPQAALGLPKSTSRREVRLGRLRVTRRSGRYYVLGEWLLEWLRAGEVSRRKEPVAE